MVTPTSNTFLFKVGCIRNNPRAKKPARSETVSEEGPLTRLRVRSFDDSILETVDDVLKQVLGETTAETIILHLEINKGLKREEIPRNIEEFSSCLAELLGSGAHLLEGLMIKLLCSKLQLEYDLKLKFTFTDYVQRLRKGFEG